MLRLHSDSSSGGEGGGLLWCEELVGPETEGYVEREKSRLELDYHHSDLPIVR